MRVSITFINNSDSIRNSMLPYLDVTHHLSTKMTYIIQLVTCLSFNFQCKTLAEKKKDSERFMVSNYIHCKTICSFAKAKKVVCIN